MQDQWKGSDRGNRTVWMRIFASGMSLFLLISLYGCEQKPERVRPDSAYKLKSKQVVNLGTFEVTGPQLVVSDPGYDLDTVKVPGQGAVLTNCEAGTWRAESVIKQFHALGFPLAAELRAFHNGITNQEDLVWERQLDAIGVDSGQAGFYDLAHFHDRSLVPDDIRWTVGRPGPADSNDLWYSYCCELSMAAIEGKVLPFGVVSNSGKGDGGYWYSIARNAAGKIVGVWIIFVNDDGEG